MGNVHLMKLNKCEYIEEELDDPRRFIYPDGLDAQRQTMHTVIGSHLLPFVHILCDYFDKEISVNECKLIIRKCIGRCIDKVLQIKQMQLQCSKEYAMYMQELEQLRKYLLNDPKETKNLFSMRLQNTMKEIYTKTGDNPLKLKLNQQSKL